MKYINELFPEGNFYRTHKAWTNEKFSALQKRRCFLGFHSMYFVLCGNTPHCACCMWHHNTTLRIRLRYLMPKH